MEYLGQTFQAGRALGFRHVKHSNGSKIVKLVRLASFRRLSLSKFYFPSNKTFLSESYFGTNRRFPPSTSVPAV